MDNVRAGTRYNTLFTDVNMLHKIMDISIDVCPRDILFTMMFSNMELSVYRSETFIFVIHGNYSFFEQMIWRKLPLSILNFSKL